MKKKISIAVPAYNEQDNIPVLVVQLLATLGKLPYDCEIVIADDGSSDGTWAAISLEAHKHAEVKGVRLARNFGHQSALVAAMSEATGDAIVSMDADLQHPPEVIPALVEAWEEGFPVVQTERIDTEKTGFFKKISSEYFYKVFSYLSNVKLKKGSSDFRLIDRSVLKNLLNMNNSFLRGSVEWLGYKSKTVPFHVGERFSGESKYSLKNMLNFARRALISHSTKPLKIGIWIGVLTSIIAFIQLAFVIYQYIYGFVVPGWASTISIISLLFGILFIMVGIIGAYIAEIHEKLLNRPDYIIGEIIFNPDNAEQSPLSKAPGEEKKSSSNTDIS